MNIPDKILNILNNINYSIKNSDDFIEIDQWQIIDIESYNKHKNKIKINNINYIDSGLSQKLDNYLVKDIKILFETKTEYGVLKYNTNFIAYSFAEREYEIHTKELELMAINRNLVNNYQDKINTPPKLTDILKTLKWSINKKSLQNIKEQLYFIE